jgi:hypothetical protein
MNKYGARRANGSASAKEAARKAELELYQKVGAIRDLKFQTKFELIPKCGKERAVTYTCDFDYIDCDTGQRVVEDSKGFKTQQYIIRRKLLNWIHHIQVLET